MTTNSSSSNTAKLPNNVQDKVQHLYRNLSGYMQTLPSLAVSHSNDEREKSKSSCCIVEYSPGKEDELEPEQEHQHWLERSMESISQQIVNNSGSSLPEKNTARYLSLRLEYVSSDSKELPENDNPYLPPIFLRGLGLAQTDRRKGHACIGSVYYKSLANNKVLSLGQIGKQDSTNLGLQMGVCCHDEPKHDDCTSSNAFHTTTSMLSSFSQWDDDAASSMTHIQQNTDFSSSVVKTQEGRTNNTPLNDQVRSSLSSSSCSRHILAKEANQSHSSSSTSSLELSSSPPIQSNEDVCNKELSLSEQVYNPNMDILPYQSIAFASPYGVATNIYLLCTVLSSEWRSKKHRKKTNSDSVDTSEVVLHYKVIFNNKFLERRNIQKQWLPFHRVVTIDCMFQSIQTSLQFEMANIPDKDERGISSSQQDGLWSKRSSKMESSSHDIVSRVATQLQVHFKVVNAAVREMKRSWLSSEGEKRSPPLLRAVQTTNLTEVQDGIPTDADNEESWLLECSKPTHYSCIASPIRVCMF